MPTNYHKPTVVDEGHYDEGDLNDVLFPSEVVINRALARFLPRLDDALAGQQTILNGHFARIAEILRLYGKGEWSLRPRTFTILKIMGCTELMDTFVSEQRSDISLPYNERNLPDIIKGELSRTAFLHLQNIVCPRVPVEELESGGDHLHFDASADDYFPTAHPLYHGQFTVVDHVYSSLSLRQYVRKRIERGQSSNEDLKRLASFEKQLRALKKLTHWHIVNFVGSYTDPFCLGIIMTPVADSDLEAYLTLSDDSNVRKQYVRRFFGCLATALEYLHGENMLHGDLKPKNILVKGANVLLADFGTTRFWEDDGRSTTNSLAECTLAYCAPEVADKKQSRGRPSDIWSLGCVFLEMATVLNKSTVETMRDFYTMTGTQAPYAWGNHDATSAWMLKLKQSNDNESDTTPLEWISRMLKMDPMERPLIPQLRGSIIDSKDNYQFMCRDCLSYTPLRASVKNENGRRTIAAAPIDERGPSVLKSTSSQNDDIVTAGMLGIVERPKTERGILREKSINTNNAFNQSYNPTIPDKGKFKTTDARGTPREQQTLAENRSNSTHESPQSPEIKSNGNSIKPQSSPAITARTRFGILPADLRPAPPVDDPLENDDEEVLFPPPQPLKPPPLHSKDCLPLPTSTLSPSYILAGTNRFSRAEIRTAKRNGASNLFVYGGLMFPNVLWAIATKSMKGVYSPVLQRRLYPSSIDWAKVDVSIKSACQAMTPARLKGFDRWRVSKLDWAVLQDSRLTGRILRAREARKNYPIQPQPPGVVIGFLIIGITDEALRYCDMLFSSDWETLNDPSILDRSDDSESNTSKPSYRPLQRQDVTVDVELSNGEIAPIDAMTYVWSHGIDHIRGLWNPERFLQGGKIHQLLGKDSGWRTQEQALASTMKISYALTGDYLCRSITAGDFPELKRLLESHFDPNGSCRIYGYPLQAAASLGDADMVAALLDYGADVNLKGGRYQTPLIAATVASRRSITEQLLKAKADVLADGGVYVNALYQAVCHSNRDIAEMFLEHGAWLDENYREILDLAREQHNTEMQELLAEYDWKRQCRKALADFRRDTNLIEDERSPRDEGGQLIKRSSRIFAAVAKKVIVLQTEPGGWRGHKLLAVVKAALDAGASPAILTYIRAAMEPVHMLIDILKDSDRKDDAEYRKAIADISSEENQYDDERISVDKEKIESYPQISNSGRRQNAAPRRSTSNGGGEIVKPRIRWGDLENIRLNH